MTALLSCTDSSVTSSAPPELVRADAGAVHVTSVASRQPTRPNARHPTRRRLGRPIPHVVRLQPHRRPRRTHHRRHAGRDVPPEPQRHRVLAPRDLRGRSFPIEPMNLDRQRHEINQLIGAATEAGADIVVLPAGRTLRGVHRPGPVSTSESSRKGARPCQRPSGSRALQAV